MATRGPRVKSNVVKFVSGTASARTAGAGAANTLKPPLKLTGRQAVLWRTFIRSAHWLQPPDAPAAWLWCSLQAECEADPAAFTAARLGQLRALANELGLTPSSRERLGVQATPPVADPLDHYFTT